MDNSFRPSLWMEFFLKTQFDELLNETSAPLCLCDLYVPNIINRFLYVPNIINRFYYFSSCLRDDERSETSRRHDDRPTTDCVSASHGRHEAWSKPVPCLFARTAD